MADDREALAELIAGIDGGRLADALTRAHDACLRAADAVLASDWLAERLADERRRALREAADAGPSSTPTDELWQMWLRERADQEQS